MSRLTYKEQLNHPKWQRRRLERLEAAGWKCEECDATNEQLHVHHERYIAGLMAWEYDDNLLKVLCHQCHEAHHKPNPRVRMGFVSKGTASLVDLAVWTLLHRCGSWGALDDAARDTLLSQSAPYGALFARIGRSLLEHGALTPAALLAELRLVPGADATAVLSRIAGFLDIDPQIEDRLPLVVAKLQLQAIEDEMKTLFDAGVSSPDAQRRSLELMNARRALKATPESRRDA